jgi:hypothetical protein
LPALWTISAGQVPRCTSTGEILLTSDHSLQPSIFLLLYIRDEPDITNVNDCNQNLVRKGVLPPGVLRVQSPDGDLKYSPDH